MPFEARSVLAKMQQLSSHVEEYLDAATTHLKPYSPLVGRFLLVVTFLEDSVRIVTQWDEQLWYLQNQRGIPSGLTHLFLMFNVSMMIAGSGMAIIQKSTMLAIAMLFGVIITQALGYGLLLDLGFFMRNLAVIGGLLMLAADALNQKDRARSVFPGIPEISETHRTKYLQLAGRLLLVLLFSSFVLGGTNSKSAVGFSWLRIIFVVLGAAACIMVALGFKAKRSAIFLVMTLSIFNVIINNWWSLHKTHPQRDFMKYDFFQILSIMGGLILLSNLGAGGVSLDEKKKAY